MKWLSIFVLCATAFGQLPNPRLTPGAVRTTSKAEVCSVSARNFRHTSRSLKHKVCRAYGIAHCPDEGRMEIDHLIPLELGGADVFDNLWPEMAPGFHAKDKVENQLHRKVCSGQMPLRQAQECIRKNWMKCE